MFFWFFAQIFGAKQSNQIHDGSFEEPTEIGNRNQKQRNADHSVDHCERLTLNRCWCDVTITCKKYQIIINDDDPLLLSVKSC